MMCAADGNFAADIHENCQHAEKNMRIFQRARPRLNFAFADMRQMEEEKKSRPKSKRRCKT